VKQIQAVPLDHERARHQDPKRQGDTHRNESSARHEEEVASRSPEAAAEHRHLSNQQGYDDDRGQSEECELGDGRETTDQQNLQPQTHVEVVGLVQLQAVVEEGS